MNTIIGVIDENEESRRWREIRPLTLEKPIFFTFQEKELEEISEWCRQTGCGRRTAYNQFKFKNRKQLNWFLLRWNHE